VKILIETGQKVPDFLESYKPADEVVKFDDDTDDEAADGEDTNNENGGTGWGGIPMESSNDDAEAPVSTGWE
jgi:ATP-dependent RNA helicase DDX3X